MTGKKAAPPNSALPVETVAVPTPSIKEVQDDGSWFAEIPIGMLPQEQLPIGMSIIGFGIKPADQFQANPNNFRLHPQDQRDIMSDILGVFGWVTGVIENRATGNLLDGHERLWEALAEGDNTLVPYVLIDITPEHEDNLLIVFDKVGEMVRLNTDSLSALIRRATITEATPDLSSFINKVGQDAGIIPKDMSDDNETGPPDAEDPDEQTQVVCPKCEHVFIP